MITLECTFAKDEEFPEDIVTSALIKAEEVVDREEEVTGSHQS